MGEAQKKVSMEGRVLYYYPAWNKKFSRRAVAGLVTGNKIYVAESVCFTGKPAGYVKDPLTKTAVWEDEKKPDVFIKKRGREIAEARARKSPSFVPGNNEDGSAKKNPAFLVIDIPNDTVAVGKLFVESLEDYLKKKGFPPKPKKPKGGPAPVEGQPVVEKREGREL